MTMQSDRPAAAEAPDVRLRRGAIGIGGMVFMVIAGTAPLTAMASNFALSIGAGAGAGTLGWIVVVAALLFVFTSAYVVLSRHVVNAGAYSAYHALGLGRAVGAATAFIAAIAYNMAVVAMVAATGFFTSVAVSSYFDVEVAWYWFAFAVIALMAVVGHFGVSAASTVATVICIVQFAFVGALVVGILVDRGGSLSLDGLAPSSMFDGNFALTLVFCMLSFASFEAAAIYGEECSAPTRKIRIATYVSLSLLVLLFFVATLTLLAAFDDAPAVAAADPGALLTSAADQYLGDWAGPLIAVFTALSFLAAALAFHNMAARYHFSLSRAGLISSRISLVHPVRGNPAAASLLQVVLTLLVVVPFVIAGLDPLTNLFPAVSAVTSLATIYVMAGCCLSALVARTRGRIDGTLWSTTIAPVIAGLGLVIIGAVVIANYQDVTGSDSTYIALMPLLLIVGAAYGVFVALRKPEVELENFANE